MSNPIVEIDLLTIAEVAQVLRLRKSAVCDLFHAGRFPGAFQVNGPGSAIRIPLDGLKRFIESGSPDGTASETVEKIVAAIRRVRGDTA